MGTALLQNSEPGQGSGLRRLVGTCMVTMVDVAQGHVAAILAAGRPVCRPGLAFTHAALCLTPPHPSPLQLFRSHHPSTFGSATASPQASFSSSAPLHLDVITALQLALFPV